MLIQFAKNLGALRSKRASVVPFTFIADEEGKYELWVLLGIHAKYKEITCLGGGVKRNESDIEAAYREFVEESNNIFPDITIDCLKECVSVSRMKEEKYIGNLKTRAYIEGITSIFLPLDASHFDTAVERFDEAIKKDTEIERLLWVRGGDILQPSNSTYKMWGFVRKFYFEALNPKLLHMLYASWSTTKR